MNKKNRKKLRARSPRQKEIEMSTSKLDTNTEQKDECMKSTDEHHYPKKSICLCKLHGCRRYTPKLLIKALEQNIQTDAIRRESRRSTLFGGEKSISLEDLRVSIALEIKPPTPLKKVQIRRHSEPPTTERKSWQDGRSSRQNIESEAVFKTDLMRKKGPSSAKQAVSTVSAKLRSAGVPKKKRKGFKQVTSKPNQSRQRLAKARQRKVSPDHMLLPFISEVTRKCCVCHSKTTFHNGGFFCKKCQSNFETTMMESATIFCSNQGKCISKQSCAFCLAETFYLQGVKASDIENYDRELYPTNIPEKPPEEDLNEDEKAFIKHVNKITDTVLDWLWNQGDLLKLTPNDRMTILKMNTGRARIMWMVADATPRHNVIRVENGYLGVRSFSDGAFKKIVVEMNNMATYFSSLDITPQHLYFIKLLSVFHTGKFSVETISKSFKHHSEEEDFERIEEIRMFEKNYKDMMQEMCVADKDIELFISFIEVMQLLSDALSKDDWIEEVEFCLKRWTTLHPDWEKARTEVLPPSLKTFSKERHEFCFYLSKMCYQALNNTKEYLSLVFTTRDQRELMQHNFLEILIIYLCSNLELLFGEDEEETADKFINMFHSELKEVEILLQMDLFKYINIADFKLLFLTQSAPDEKLKLRDCGIKNINNYIKSSLLNSIEKQIKDESLKRGQKFAKIAKLKKSLDLSIENVKKVAAIFTSWKGELPLFINVKMWVTERQ